ncbi:hypothetical protein C8Q77DRAFT_1146329 [Trametes polyzona]|nr:hypothetical protein C8Q77DRAFT_1146329 [Trametes polyzona]
MLLLTVWLLHSASIRPPSILLQNGLLHIHYSASARSLTHPTYAPRAPASPSAPRPSSLLARLSASPVSTLPRLPPRTHSRSHSNTQGTPPAHHDERTRAVAPGRNAIAGSMAGATTGRPKDRTAPAPARPSILLTVAQAQVSGIGEWRVLLVSRRRKRKRKRRARCDLPPRQVLDAQDLRGRSRPAPVPSRRGRHLRPQASAADAETEAYARVPSCAARRWARERALARFPRRARSDKARTRADVLKIARARRLSVPAIRFSPGLERPISALDFVSGCR